MEQAMTSNGFSDAQQEKRSLANSAMRVGAAITVWVVLRIMFSLSTIPILNLLKAQGVSDNLQQIIIFAFEAAGLYLVATPIALWVLGIFKEGKFKAMFAKSSMPARQVAAAIPMLYTVTIFINFIATIVNLILSGSIEKVVADNPFLSMPTGTLGVVLNYVWTVAVAPIFEEILFRGGILGTLKKYGNWFAVIVSALLFGLAHTNIAQMLYATALGMMLGIMYVRAGSVTPCIITHIAINLIGISIAISYTAHNMILLAILVLVMIATVITGLVFVILTLTKYRNNLRLGASNTTLSKRERFATLLRSPMFVLMFVLALALNITVNVPAVSNAIDVLFGVGA